MKENFSVQDECLLEGAVAVMRRYANHTARKVDAVVRNYEASDFDKVAFLTDIDYALNNADVVIATANTVKEKLKALRAEVSPIFDKEDE